MLSNTVLPVRFEIIGTNGKINIQFVCCIKDNTILAYGVFEKGGWTYICWDGFDKFTKIWNVVIDFDWGNHKHCIHLSISEF